MNTFHRNDAGYLAWHANHRDGFVLNRFGGRNPAFNVLHRSDCVFLWREADEGSRTAVEKWCSDSEQELRQQAVSILGSQMWKACGICFRSSRSPGLNPPAPATVPPPSLPESGATPGVQPFWIAGEPAVWLGSGEKEWKQRVTAEFNAVPPSGFPKWIDVEFRFLEQRLYRKDIDNLLTPILESARDGGWIEKGFAQLGSVTARKVVVESLSDVGAVVTTRASPPLLAGNRTGVLVEAAPAQLDEAGVKWALYESPFDLYQRRPELRYPPQSSLSVEVRVTVRDPGRRKSIQALLKPCIDGLEPILGHPDNLLPEPRDVLQRRLAPQDEMILSLTFHVRGGTSNHVSAVISPHQRAAPDRPEYTDRSHPGT
jgi:hypothetical protein